MKVVMEIIFNEEVLINFDYEFFLYLNEGWFISSNGKVKKNK